MYINSTIHPYHQIVKSKVHQNQPFLKSICYYIRIEDRKRERKGRKEQKNGHIIILLLSTNQPKIQTISKCKRCSNYWNSKIQAENAIYGIPEIRTIFTIIPIYGIPFMQHIISIFLFVEFQKQALISKFSICVFPGVLPIFEMDRFLEFQQQGLFGQHPDFWNSKNMGIASLPIPFSLLSRSGLIQNALNNLTFYPYYKELVGYLFHFSLSKKLWRSAIH